jgi:IclR helix-turn-helix domain
MSHEHDVTITLTATQIAQVIRDAASRRVGVAARLSGLSSPHQLQGVLLSLLNDKRVSQSIIRGLLVLGAFPSDGSYGEITDVAKQLQLSQSTTYRYARTWLATGLLEQDPATRRYRQTLNHEGVLLSLSLSHNDRVSQSIIRGLLVLGAFPSDGSYREITDVVKQLQLSQSSTHRYVRTWLATGLLEQDPATRRYRQTTESRPSVSP